MKQLTPLYKIDSKDRIREYIIEFDSTHFITYAGLHKGKLVKNETFPIAKGKNTLTEQVEKEARSKWRKKYERELYTDDLSKPHLLAFTQPMPALDYTKVPNRLIWNLNTWVAQPKLNGVRCIVKYLNGLVQLTSRKGTIYHVPHIAKFFTHLYEKFAPHNRIFDGELYLHNVELGAVTHAVSHGDPQLLFKLFDHVDENKTFAERYFDICVYALPLATTAIDIVQTDIINNEADLFDVHREYLKSGYEGAMIRDQTAKYTIGKRTPGMFKYKHFQDSEFEIVNVLLDKNGGAILELKTPTGVLFNSRPRGSNTYRKHLVKDMHKLVGKMATVKYSELLKTGIPEFNRVIAIRDYE